MGGSSLPAPHREGPGTRGLPGDPAHRAGCPSPAPPAGGDGTESPSAPSAAAGRGWCSTWGAGHFSTFDGRAYDFEGTCNYVFAASCEDAAPSFSVQLRRGPGGNVSRLVVELGASVVTVQGAVSVRDVG